MIMETEAKFELKNENGMYTVKNGDKVTPKEMAGTLSDAIEHYNNQIKTTKDARKIKKLKDKLRSVKIWINQHEDVRQFLK
jgi:hypothetical protein